MATDTRQVDQRLASLKIDRSQRGGEPARWAKWWIIIGVVAFAALGIWRFGFAEAGLIEVDTIRVIPQTAGMSGQQVVLNAAGYVIAHYKIEVASKVLGKVAWIGVEKGDAVTKGDAIVRVEDDEYLARVRQAEGNLAALQARLAELEAGLSPRGDPTCPREPRGNQSGPRKRPRQPRSCSHSPRGRRCAAARPG